MKLNFRTEVFKLCRERGVCKGCDGNPQEPAKNIY